MKMSNRPMSSVFSSTNTPYISSYCYTLLLVLLLRPFPFLTEAFSPSLIASSPLVQVTTSAASATAFITQPKFPPSWTPHTNQRHQIVTLRNTMVFGEKSNSFRSILGNVASSLSNIQRQGMMTSVSPAQLSHLQSLTAETLSSNYIGSWDQIRSTLESKQTSDEERNFRKNLEKGYGIASPLHKLRLFDESNREEDVRVTLFRDSASWCPYCQKVSFDFSLL